MTHEMTCRCTSLPRDQLAPPTLMPAASAALLAAAWLSCCCQPLMLGRVTVCQLASTAAGTVVLRHALVCLRGLRWEMQLLYWQCASPLVDQVKLVCLFMTRLSSDLYGQCQQTSEKTCGHQHGASCECRVIEPIVEEHPVDVCPPGCDHKHAFHFVRLPTGLLSPGKASMLHAWLQHTACVRACMRICQPCKHYNGPARSTQHSGQNPASWRALG